ncbi:hypothetical protein SAMN05216246_10684 [Actinomyces denticolens]|uniref:Excreted virulence factor EspC, type VII ESX diderm n=2 Tax=Actinomyces denticolens TaxID=52767 RepID=A0ABY1IAF8_9ACTO|nr:hypothetical protein SAMN05216246_10684 [Actinomyces denticolens]
MARDGLWGRPARGVPGPTYRRAMAQLDIASADTEVDAASVPSTVPASWTGLAANQCQSALDSAVLLIPALNTLLDTAASAAKDFDAMRGGAS